MTAAKHAAPKPKRKAAPKTPEQKMEMIPRFLRSLRKTWTENPEMLAFYDDMIRILQESRQVAVANALEARRQDPTDIHVWSTRELGAALGVSGQSVSELGVKGRAVLAEEQAFANVSQHREAYREKLRQAPTAAKVADIRAARPAPVAADEARTGTDG